MHLHALPLWYESDDQFRKLHSSAKLDKLPGVYRDTANCVYAFAQSCMIAYWCRHLTHNVMPPSANQCTLGDVRLAQPIKKRIDQFVHDMT